MNRSALVQEVLRRRSCRDRIRSRVDDLVVHARGIEDFSARLDGWFPPKEEFTLTLARQIPSVSVECLAMKFLGEWVSQVLPARTDILGFTRDSWGSNPYKRSLTSLPVIRGIQSKNRIEIRPHKIVTKEYRPMLGSSPPLEQIPVILKRKDWGIEMEGMLPEAHDAMRQLAYGHARHPSPDVSTFWEQCVRTSTAPPPYVFANDNGKTIRLSTWSKDDERYIRPPASWYYLAYLCMFCSGERALIATVLEDDDEKIQNLFRTEIEHIELRVGVAPLILFTPHHSPTLTRTDGNQLDFNCLQPKVFASGWESRIVNPCSDASVHDAASDLLHQFTLL